MNIVINAMMHAHIVHKGSAKNPQLGSHISSMFG